MSAKVLPRSCSINIIELIPAHGGFLVARAESLEALQALLAEEPFVKAGKMSFSRITEFEPAQSQPFLADWFSGQQKQ